MDLPLEHVSDPPIDGADRPPAVVFLHGRGSHERDLLGLRGDLPDGLHALAVRAPDPLGPGYTWYDLDLSGGGLHDSQPDPTDFRRSLDALHAFVDGAVDAYGLDPDRVGLFGFSQGAILGASAVVERPARYAWLAGLHGYLPASHDPTDPADDVTLDVAGAASVPVFLGAGADDEVIPAARTERAAAALSDAGLDVTFERFPGGHGIGPDELAAVTAWVRDRA
ncbi:MAG: alpha/beta hydrolase [Halobacteriaceae archaeon]